MTSSNPIYLLGLLIDSFIAFFSWVIMIQVLIKLFSFKNHRVRSGLRLLPFINLIIDYTFHQYSITRWLNPLSCTSCVQKFILETFYPQINAYLSANDISLIRYLGLEHQHSSFSLLMFLCGTSSLYFVGGYFVQAYQQAMNIKSVIKNSILSTRPIHSVLLVQKLYKHQAKIYISKETTIPCASFNKIIIIPKTTLDNLSQTEFEAVVAHELEHIVHHDPIIRLFYHCIAIFFWWVPTKTWIEKMEYEQELACDQNVMKYGLANDAIASALFKITKQIRIKQKDICFFANGKNLITSRIKTILGLDSNLPKVSLMHISFGSIGIFFLLICLIK
jgi:beta-lactamase regulating signal transducer with metallopeptidase domain